MCSQSDWTTTQYAQEYARALDTGDEVTQDIPAASIPEATEWQRTTNTTQ